jgi:hypothetical protein
MTTDTERLAALLDAVAAETRVLADDIRQGRLWPSDLRDRLTQITQRMHDANEVARRRR